MSSSKKPSETQKMLDRTTSKGEWLDGGKRKYKPKKKC